MTRRDIKWKVDSDMWILYSLCLIISDAGQNDVRTNVTLQPASTFVSVDFTKENRFQFNCSATSDPSTSPTFRWYKVGNQSQEPVNSEPPCVYVMDGNLTIHTEPNCSTACDKYLGEYRCIDDNGYTQDTATVILNGTTAAESCSREFLESSDAKVDWPRPTSDASSDKLFRYFLIVVYSVKGDALNQTMVAEIARQLSTLTNKSEGLSPGNLNASVMIVNRLAFLLSDSNVSASAAEPEIKSMIQVASNVLRPNNSDAWKEFNDVNRNIVMSLLFSLDVCARCLSALSTASEHRVEEGDNLFLESWSLEKPKLPIQIQFPGRSVWDEQGGDEISISLEALNSGIRSSESSPILSMWGVYYRNVNDYLPRNNDSFVNSRILSFSIDGLKTSATLKPPVRITLRHNQEKRLSFRRTCVFWNFERGDWDSFGCSVSSTNKTHTICSCDHLTNFAILMSRNPVYDKLLSIISIVGCSISVAALILTVIVYAVTWKHAKSSQAAILLNLCVALIIAYVIFLTGAGMFDSKFYFKVECKVVAVLLHYFFLVAFFIMLAEGIDMVLYIFFVFHVRRTRETIMLIASAWGLCNTPYNSNSTYSVEPMQDSRNHFLPLIIVGVSLGVTKLEGYGHEEACWLSIEKGLIWAFVGPVLFIIAVNLVTLIIILGLISQKRAQLAKNAKKRDEIRATIWNLSVMCPVLGLGWLFGVFSVTFDHVAFQYLFVIANSLHGLLIFIIYALFHNKKMNEKICDVYSKYIGRCEKVDPSVSIKLTTSQDQSTNSTGNTEMTSVHHISLGCKE